METSTLCIAAGIAVVLMVFLMTKSKDSDKKEGLGASFINMNPSALSNIGTYEPATGKLISGEFDPPISSPKIEGFAPEDAFKRMETLQGAELLPKTTSGITQWAVDAADPATFSFAVQAPRVQLRPKLGTPAYAMVRGDIGITYYPEIPMVGRSQYDRDNWISGFFSPQNQMLFSRFNGSEYRNMPMHVSGSTGSIIMDN